MSSSNPKQTVKNYLRGHRKGDGPQVSLKSRYPTKPRPLGTPANNGSSDTLYKNEMVDDPSYSVREPGPSMAPTSDFNENEPGLQHLNYSDFASKGTPSIEERELTNNPSSSRNTHTIEMQPQSSVSDRSLVKSTPAVSEAPVAARPKTGKRNPGIAARLEPGPSMARASDLNEFEPGLQKLNYSDIASKEITSSEERELINNPSSSRNTQTIEMKPKSSILTIGDRSLVKSIPAVSEVPAAARPKTGKRNPAIAAKPAPVRKHNNTIKRFPKSSTLISLPDELQLRIMSFLTSADLLVCARVCKHWNYLANDNVLWKDLFQKIAQKKTKKSGKVLPPLKDAGDAFQYWKWQCVKRSTEDRNQVLKLLTKIDNYTGLPKSTDKCLQHLAVQWKLAFVDRDSIETFVSHRDVFYHRISISVRWYDLEMPPVNRMKILRLYAGCPVFFQDNKPLKNSACQMSLLYEFDLDWSRFVSQIPPVAADDRIELRILSPIMIATWKDGGEIAFISACLHNNNLVEVCLEANRRRAALQIMRRPKAASYSNMFGYNITLELRNQRQSFWSDQFRSIYFDKDQIASGKALMKLISSDHNFKHTPIRGKLDMPWKTDLFKNILKNVTILDIVLQDEQNKPVWCVSTPVNISKPDSASPVVYDYDGDFSVLDYKDGVGHLHMDLVWEEEIGHYMLTCLQVELNMSALGVTVYGLQ